MTIKTPEELRKHCQKVADLTGCVVTVSRYKLPLIWNTSTAENITYVHGGWTGSIFYFVVILSLLDKIDFPIPDPENWLFEPKETSNEKD